MWLSLSPGRSRHPETPGSQSLLQTHLCFWPPLHRFILLVGVCWGSRWVGAFSQGLEDKSQIKGRNFSRAPSFTWAPDELGPGVWLCNKENNVLSPDTGPHWRRTQPCLRHPGMCEALRGCFAPSGILTAAWQGGHCPYAHFPDEETNACPRSPACMGQSHGGGWSVRRPCPLQPCGKALPALRLKQTVTLE